jgi:hypothetical protein
MKWMTAIQVSKTKDEPWLRLTLQTIFDNGPTFLKDAEEDGQHFQVHIVKTILDEDEERQKDPHCIKFLCSVNGDTADEILSYNEVLDHIERDNNEVDNNTEQYYKFRCIGAHQGPLKIEEH